MKGTLAEGGIRIPLSVTWVDQLQAGHEFEAPVSTLDVYPTSVRAAKAELPSGADGVNLIPALSGSELLDRPALFWKTGFAEQWAVRSGDAKLLHVAGLDRRMFNLAEDPREQHALAPDERLQALYMSWADSLPPEGRVKAVADFKWPEQAESVGVKPDARTLKRAAGRDRNMKNLLKKALPPGDA